MRDYIIEALPYSPTLRIEQVPPDRVPRITEEALKLMEAKGYQRGEPGYLKHHLLEDESKPPRMVVMMIASQAIHELKLAGCRPTTERRDIGMWLMTLPDEALLNLLRECVLRVN